MATKAEAIAERNHKNAQSSTGPRTASGKATASKNATKHGIQSTRPVLPGESAAEVNDLVLQAQQELSIPGRIGEEMAGSFALLVQQDKRVEKYFRALTEEKLMAAVDVNNYDETPIIRILDDQIEDFESMRDLWLREEFREAAAVREIIGHILKMVSLVSEKTNERSPVENLITSYEQQAETISNEEAGLVLKKLTEAVEVHVEFISRLKDDYIERRKNRIKWKKLQAHIPTLAEMRRLDKYRASNENSFLRKLEMAQRIKGLTKT